MYLVMLVRYKMNRHQSNKAFYPSTVYYHTKPLLLMRTTSSLPPNHIYVYCYVKMLYFVCEFIATFMPISTKSAGSALLSRYFVATLCQNMSLTCWQPVNLSCNNVVCVFWYILVAWSMCTQSTVTPKKITKTTTVHLWQSSVKQPSSRVKSYLII